LWPHHCFSAKSQAGAHDPSAQAISVCYDEVPENRKILNKIALFPLACQF
jgi:hypothetical protein